MPNKPPTHPVRLKALILTTGLSPIVQPLLDSGHTIVGIVDCSGKEAESAPASTLYRLLRAGHRLIRSDSPSLASVAAQRNIPYYRTDRAARDPQLAAWIQARHPDVIAVYYAPILGPHIFTIPPLGTINLHPSLLPAYRGGHPLFWSVHNGDTQAGTSVHFVEARTDAGDILYQHAFPIQPGMSEATLERLAIDHHGVRLMLKALDVLAAGVCPRTPQPALSTTPAANRVNAEKLRRLIDWNHWPIERVWSVLRFGEAWQNVLPCPPGWKSPFRWKLGHYTQEPVTGPPGSIAQDRRGYYLVHPEGKIRLSVHYDPRRYVKWVLLRLKGYPATCYSYLLIIACNQQFIYPLLEL